MRVRALKNELEEAWCCSEVLVPVRSPVRAAGLCFVNVILPGVGTAISGCCAVQPNEDEASAAEAAGDPLGDDDDDERKDGPPAPPPVVAVDRKPKWSPLQAALTGSAQFFTASCGMGWIWSISHGLVLYENARIYEQIDRIEAEPDSDGEGDEDPNDFGGGGPKQNGADNVFG